MKNLSKILKPLVWIILLASVLGFGFGLYCLYMRVNTLSDKVDKLNFQDGNTATKAGQEVAPLSVSTPQCNQACQDEIAEAVSGAIATISGSATKETAEKTTFVTQSSGGISYTPLGTTATTTSTSWVDVTDSDVYVDLINEYGEDATVSWEASLKVAHANGKAYARLYDDTNKIAVDLSEISTTDNADYVWVSTGDLPFWRGRNLYKVQIKSLNSFEISYSGGRLRINH